MRLIIQISKVRKAPWTANHLSRCLSMNFFSTIYPSINPQAGRNYENHTKEEERSFHFSFLCESNEHEPWRTSLELSHRLFTSENTLHSRTTLKDSQSLNKVGFFRVQRSSSPSRSESMGKKLSKKWCLSWSHRVQVWFLFMHSLSLLIPVSMSIRVQNLNLVSNAVLPKNGTSRCWMELFPC